MNDILWERVYGGKCLLHAWKKMKDGWITLCGIKSPMNNKITYNSKRCSKCLRVIDRQGGHEKG